MTELPRIEAMDGRFEALLRPDSRFELIADGLVFSEGPLWMPEERALVWSDVRTNRMWRWTKEDGASVLRDPSGVANGNALDGEGRLITCEMRGRGVVRTERDGSTTVLADSYDGGKLNSPNDVVVKSDGTVWFTDPDYGLVGSDVSSGAAKEQGGNYVFRLDPETGDLSVVAGDFDKPNGLAFSPDESLLYIVDSARTDGEDRAHHLRVFDVVDGVRLSGGRVFAVIEPWIPDGLKVGPGGEVFTTAGDGVQVFTPEGELIGKFLTPEVAANCAFGGPAGDTLFICATASVWAIRLSL